MTAFSVSQLAHLDGCVVEVGEAVLDEDLPVGEEAVHHRGVVRRGGGGGGGGRRGARPRGQHSQRRQYHCWLDGWMESSSLSLSSSTLGASI